MKVFSSFWLMIVGAAAVETQRSARSTTFRKWRFKLNGCWRRSFHPPARVLLLLVHKRQHIYTYSDIKAANLSEIVPNIETSTAGSNAAP